MPQKTHLTLTLVLVTTGEVERLLREVEVEKATGLDDVSLQLLKKCAKELLGPLSTGFATCLRENKWPSLWKEERVVPFHKKGSLSVPSNYGPIFRFSVVGKLLGSSSK